MTQVLEPNTPKSEAEITVEKLLEILADNNVLSVTLFETYPDGYIVTCATYRGDDRAANGKTIHEAVNSLHNRWNEK